MPVLRFVQKKELRKALLQYNACLGQTYLRVNFGIQDKSFQVWL